MSNLIAGYTLGAKISDALKLEGWPITKFTIGVGVDEIATLTIEIALDEDTRAKLGKAFSDAE